MNQPRVATVGNCFGYTCVINEEFCNETKRGCEMCTYVHNECTPNMDCLKFCSEKAAQEICGGSEEIVETAWWLYLLIAILVASLLTNIGFIICKIIKCKKQEPKLQKGSQKERGNEDENRGLVSSHPGNDIPMNNSEMDPVAKEPTAPSKREMPRGSQTEIQRGPIAQDTSDVV